MSVGMIVCPRVSVGVDVGAGLRISGNVDVIVSDHTSWNYNALDINRKKYRPWT
jgi:hypothetical protein